MFIEHTYLHSLAYSVLLASAVFSFVTLLFVVIPKDLELTWKLHLKKSNVTYLPPVITVCSPMNHTAALLNVNCFLYQASQRHDRHLYPCEQVVTGETVEPLSVLSVEGYGPLSCMHFNEDNRYQKGPFGTKQLHLHFPDHTRELLYFIYHRSTPMDSVQYDVAVPDSVTTVGLQRKERRPYHGPVEVRYDSAKNVIPAFGVDDGVHLIVRYHTAYVESWVEDLRQASWWERGYRFATLLLCVEKVFSFARQMLGVWREKKKRPAFQNIGHAHSGSSGRNNTQQQQSTVNGSKTPLKEMLPTMPTPITPASPSSKKKSQ
eukprot:PhF_6_TR31366/c0_g1_i2/m.45924